MMTDQFFIRSVDHRISTALIFFLLLLLANGRRRSAFSLRAGLCLAVLCLASWFVRYVIDAVLLSAVLQGVGHSVHLLVMSLLYWCSFAFCYEGAASDYSYSSLLALTIYKLAWNTFKVGAAVGIMSYTDAPWSTYSILGSLVSYVVYIVVCVPACRLHRKVTCDMKQGAFGELMFPVFIFFLFCQLILEFCGRVFTADSSARFLYYLCALMYTVINYILLLAVAQLTRYRQDNEDMHRFIQNKMQYYQMSHDGITSLQIKCHDLKHQIAAIRSQVNKENFEKNISRLEDSLIEYGTVVECGNETINTVLTEKNILCSTCGVKFSYMLDGSIFDFMSEMEIYSLFGNALDNALESCRKIGDSQKRVISLKANTRGELVVLRIENYFDEPPTLVDGMPITTKKGPGHGFGLRSIQQIAERYRGFVSIQVQPPVFRLIVVLQPDETV